MSPKRSWSITGRLTVLYTLSSFGMLAVATAFLYWVLRANLQRADEDFLAQKIHVLRVLLQQHPDKPQALEEEVVWEGSGLQITKYYARVLDSSLTTVVETPDMAAAVPTRSFPLPQRTPAGDSPPVVWHSDSGRPFLLRSAWANLGRDAQARRLIQVALDISSEQSLVRDYGRKVAIVLVLGLIFASVGGALLARRGMKPLAEITQAAQRITSSQLHERIAAPGWPNELSALATAFDGMLSRLENSFRRLSQFSADLAHELRTPINNLMGEAEVGLSRERSPDEYRDVLESILEECGRLSRMIDRLLFLARAENAQTRIERTRLNACHEMKAVRDFHEALAEEQGVRVVCTGDAEMDADPFLFRRALANLLSNALQFTAAGGTVTLAAVATEDGSVDVHVRDTGSGIDPEHLPHIFDRFYRADRSRSQNPAGTGLGLAIVKSIMELHGGSVAISSTPGRGTTVTLHFPTR